MLNSVKRLQIRPFLRFDEDPLFSLAGAFSFPPAEIDSTLYGAIKRRSQRRGRGSRAKLDRRR
jgi:hypothetical protein